MRGKESDDHESKGTTSQQAIRQQVAELEAKTHRLNVDEEEEKFKKEEIELREILNETPFLRLVIPGPIERVAKYSGKEELIRLAATCKWIRFSLYRDCEKEFKAMNKKIDLEKIGMEADIETLIDINRALPELRKLKLGIIKTSQIMKYIKRFKKLRQLEISLRRNHYFSGDRVLIDHLKIRNDGGSNKNIVQFLSNFRELKSLTLYNFKLTTDTLRAIYQHRKSLTKLAFINCNERLKPLDDWYIFGLQKLKKLKILNLFSRNLLDSFEARYMKRMPHQLDTFELDHIFPNFDVPKMRTIKNIKIQYYARYLAEEQESFIEFIEKLNQQPITLVLQDQIQVDDIRQMIIENFIGLVKTINPLINQTIAKCKI